MVFLTMKALTKRFILVILMCVPLKALARTPIDAGETSKVIEKIKSKIQKMKEEYKKRFRMQFTESF
jgi:hypothetical protein